MSTNIPPISVQLYTLRDACQEDFDGVLTQLANIGYAGVEPFSLFGKSPDEFCRQVQALGMQVSSSHFPWTNRTDNLNEVVETIQALGLTRAPGGFAPDDFKDKASLEQTIATTAGLVDALKIRIFRLLTTMNRFQGGAGRGGKRYSVCVKDWF